MTSLLRHRFSTQLSCRTISRVSGTPTGSSQSYRSSPFIHQYPTSMLLWATAKAQTPQIGIENAPTNGKKSYGGELSGRNTVVERKKRKSKRKRKRTRDRKFGLTKWMKRRSSTPTQTMQSSMTLKTLLILSECSSFENSDRFPMKP